MAEAAQEPEPIKPTVKVLVAVSYVKSASDPIVLFPDQIVTLPATPEPLGIWELLAKNDVA